MRYSVPASCFQHSTQEKNASGASMMPPPTESLSRVYAMSDGYRVEGFAVEGPDLGEAVVFQ